MQQIKADLLKYMGRDLLLPSCDKMDGGGCCKGSNNSKLVT